MRSIAIRCFSVVVFLTLLSVCFAAGANAEKKIGILSFSEEVRYLDAISGFLGYLKEHGYRKPDTTFIVDNAGANKAKAAELVQKFAAAKMDLIFTVGSSMTIPVARTIKDVPIVFSIVYDPVAAGVAESWQSSGNNTTGTSTKVAMSKVVDALTALLPVKKLAVLYTPGEKNSESQLKDLQGVQAVFKIRVLPVPLTRKEEIDEVLPEIVRTTDAIYVTGSNLVGSEIARIVDITTKARVVTITHLDDLVMKGVLVGVTPDSHKLGRMAAEKAVKILNGAKPSSLPIESLKEFDLMLNMRTVHAGQFPIPPAFLKKVRTKIE